MRTTFLSELKELKTDMLQMGAYIEDAIKNTMTALVEDDLLLAQEVINKDCIIDDAERTIENLCLKLLLTQQPVATDMRMISSALKMITDMERIGDFAADIAEIVTKGGRTGTGYHIELILRKKSANRTTRWIIYSTEPKTCFSIVSATTKSLPSARSISCS